VKAVRRLRNLDERECQVFGRGPMRQRLLLEPILREKVCTATLVNPTITGQSRRTSGTVIRTPVQYLRTANSPHTSQPPDYHSYDVDYSIHFFSLFKGSNQLLKWVSIVPIITEQRSHSLADPSATASSLSTDTKVNLIIGIFTIVTGILSTLLAWAVWRLTRDRRNRYRQEHGHQSTTPPQGKEVLENRY